jgi:DNA-binding YbaB/EbfC family protein
MLGGLGNMLEVLKGARELQSKMAELQKELESRRYDAATGGGAVRVVVDGKGTVLEVKIDPSATADVELLEELVRSAVATALSRSQEAMAQEFARLTGGLNLGGLERMLRGS